MQRALAKNKEVNTLVRSYILFDIIRFHNENSQNTNETTIITPPCLFKIYRGIPFSRFLPRRGVCQIEAIEAGL